MPDEPLKILQVAPEIAPYAKVGGLADVVGAMTQAFSEAGHDVRALVPKYGFLQPDEHWTAQEDPLCVHLGQGMEAYCKIWQMPYKDSPGQVNWLEYNKYFERHEIYTGPWGGHADNHERFTLLARAAIDYCHSRQWFPDVIHCHDWTTGFVPVYLNQTEMGTPLRKAATVFTVHNLQHQGIFGRDVLDFAGLPQSLFRPDSLESVGNINMMKGGLYNASKLTTVSPNYAREIQAPYLGCGLNHVLKFRAADLIGVVNGIDTREWNPAHDPLIPANFSADDLSGKATCKAELQKTFGLEVRPDIPIFSAVARLYDQKGLDLLAAIADELMRNMAIQVVLLGAGDPALETTFRELAARYPGRFGTYIGYNNALAHLVEAGSDFFVMPSRFEPCGLNQLYSMAYATLPIVRSTGGLVDTVSQYTEGRGEGTGFRFEEISSRALYYTMGWACATYYDRPAEFQQLRQNAIRQELGWEQSARIYDDVYRWAVDARLRGLGLSTRTSLSHAPFKATGKHP